MFSTTQLDVLEGLVPTLRAEGYLYYVAVTDNTRSDNTSPDLIVYFSKKEIVSSEWLRFFIPSDSLKYEIRSGNASSYNNTGARFSVSVISNSDFITVDSDEFVSTNSKYTTSSIIQPDYIVGEVGSYEIQGALLVSVCVFIFFMFFVKLFRR